MKNTRTYAKSEICNSSQYDEVFKKMTENEEKPILIHTSLGYDNIIILSMIFEEVDYSL